MGSATIRSATMLPSMSKPPIFSLRSRNCCDGDLARVERAEAVLDADVVERTTGEAGLRVAAADVHAVIPHVAARALGVLHRVVPQLRGQLRRAALGRAEARRAHARQIVHRRGDRKAGARP